MLSRQWRTRGHEYANIIKSSKILKMKKLTNKQMSSITGGEFWFCTYKGGQQDSDDVLPPIGPDIIVEANSAGEAADKVHEITGASQVNCTRC